MTFVITEICIDVRDESCIEVCPVDCIHADEEDRICYIDPDVCIDCAVCVEACPVAAIFSDEETPEASKDFIEINAQWFKDKDKARQMVDEKAD
ncbi:MAG: 4Fe-4S binding protein [Alphaproteobacteria bacterium]|nr:4Fe-4S binding protein [Alphaproteobacteria bacterium]